MQKRSSSPREFAFAVRIGVAILGVGILGSIGCDQRKQATSEKRPRPVATIKLKRRPPPDRPHVAASVAAWKSENIGFEVGGRVEFVVEQNTLIEGRIDDRDGNNMVEGTPIARLETERFKLPVMRAKAEVERIKQNRVAAQTELEEELPAKIEAAQASQQLAETEFERSRRLVAQNAGAQSDLDRDRSNLASAQANIKQLQAAVKAKEAQLASLDSQILQAEQNQRDAERNLEDCTLFASFRGQVADVLVVPGSIVDAGTPVVRLQTVDPIRVELEVSAQQSRQIQRTEIYPVQVKMPDGSVEIHDGFLHQIDSVADPLTRTYTVTLLVQNKRITPDIQAEMASTSDIWRLDLQFIPGAEAGRLFVEENSILEDNEGSFMWMVTNVTIQNRTTSGNLLDVRKIRAKKKEKRVPYLGNLFFQEVEVLDNDFDPRQHLVVGRLSVSEGEAAGWNGSQVIIESGNRWMLRPGDLVKVDLTKSENVDGYYLPLDAIVQRNGETAVYVVDDSGSEALCKKVVVEVVDENAETSSGIRQIRAIEGTELEGLRCIVQGTHYLVDGEKVNEVSSMEAPR